MEESPLRHSKRSYPKDRDSGNHYDRRGSRRENGGRGMDLATNNITDRSNLILDNSPYRKHRRSCSPSSRSKFDSKYSHVDHIDSSSLKQSKDTSKSISFKEASQRQKRTKNRDRESLNFQRRLGGNKERRGDNFKIDSDRPESDRGEMERGLPTEHHYGNDGADTYNNNTKNTSNHNHNHYSHDRRSHSSRSPREKSRSRSPQSRSSRRRHKYRKRSISPNNRQKHKKYEKYSRSVSNFPVYDDENPSSPHQEKASDEKGQGSAASLTPTTHQASDGASSNSQSQKLPDDRGKIKISLSGRRNPNEIPKGPSAYDRTRGRHKGRDDFPRYNSYDNRFHNKQKEPWKEPKYYSHNPQIPTYTDEQPDEIRKATPAQSPSPKIKYGIVEYIPNSVYKRISQIGEGTYGKVYKARNLQTLKMVALKLLRMESERDGFPITAIREIKLLQSLRHPNIVSLLEMMVEKSQVYMVFEYLDHDLAGILSHPHLTFNEGNIKYLFKQMAEGLAYMHHRGILHRDIKGPNILLSNTGQVKIADFGLARSIDLLNPDALYTNRVITLWYRPPELLLGETKYNGAVDIWGLGCILAEFFVRKALFQSKDAIGQIKSIYSILGTPLENGWPEAVELPWYQLIQPREPRASQLVAKLGQIIPNQALMLIEKMLKLNPKVRYTADEMLKDPYFTEGPKIERPVQLESLTEEWHDFEAKQRRRRRKEVSTRPHPEVPKGVSQDTSREAENEGSEDVKKTMKEEPKQLDRQ